MSNLNDIVKVVIDRQTQAITRASFGTLAIISEFPSNKTTVEFDRYRYYAGIIEMSDDGWGVGDPEYDAAVIVFSQNPKLDKIMIGRKDSGDDDWSETLTTIQSATQDWYCFLIIASQAGTIVFDSDFETGNLIDFTINGTAVTQILFNTTQADTMADIKTQIEIDISDSLVTIDSSDPNNRTLIIEIFTGVDSISVIVTGGGTQPVGSITYVNEDDYKAVASWTETQKKIFFYCSSSSAIKNPVSTSDIAFFMKNLAYSRTCSIYHTDAQGDVAPSYLESGIPGECLPYDPGSQTWAYKTIAGVAPYGLTSGERSAILGKNCNIYTTTAGVNITEEGKVAGGEYIDIIRGVDWLEARLQEEIFTNLINVRKISLTDEGIAIIVGTVAGVLYEGADQGLLVRETIVVTFPKASEISQADKLNRNLPDIKFTAVLQGAIHTVEINGIVTV